MSNPLDGGRGEVSSSYDRWAATYDTAPNRTRDLAARVLRQTILLLTDRDVVEIGCGTGQNTEWLDSRARTVLALDFSEGMLREARRRSLSQRVRFVQHDIRYAWPIPDASADLIIATLVLEHVEAIEPIFVEAARTLRPGGELFICELHPLRQTIGKQAEFTVPETGDRERITAFLHDVSEYVNGGLRTGLTLLELGEWRDLEAQRSDLPRLLSLHFRTGLRP